MRNTYLAFLLQLYWMGLVVINISVTHGVQEQSTMTVKYGDFLPII